MSDWWIGDPRQPCACGRGYIIRVPNGRGGWQWAHEDEQPCSEPEVQS